MGGVERHDVPTAATTNASQKKHGKKPKPEPEPEPACMDLKKEKKCLKNDTCAWWCASFALAAAGPLRDVSKSSYRSNAWRPVLVAPRASHALACAGHDAAAWQFRACSADGLPPHHTWAMRTHASCPLMPLPHCQWRAAPTSSCPTTPAPATRAPRPSSCRPWCLSASCRRTRCRRSPSPVGSVERRDAARAVCADRDEWHAARASSGVRVAAMDGSSLLPAAPL